MKTIKMQLLALLSAGFLSFASTASAEIEIIDEDVLLSEGEVMSYRFFYQAGERVHLFAECDEDGRDLDIAVYGPSGNLVAEDVLEDAIPIVNFRARRSGWYTVRVDMYDTFNGIPSYVTLARDY